MDVNLWLEKAKSSVAKLSDLDKFEVRSLFQGCEWEALSKGERIIFGKFFKSEVIEGHIAGVQFLGRAKNNHSEYQKMGETEE